MSYNITGFRPKKGMRLVIPPGLVKKYLSKKKGDWDQWEENDDGTWSFNHHGEGVMISGHKDMGGNYVVDEFSAGGDFSGNMWSDIGEPLLRELAKDKKNKLEATIVWEGGDSIQTIKLADGKYTEGGLDEESEDEDETDLEEDGTLQHEEDVADIREAEMSEEDATDPPVTGDMVEEAYDRHGENFFDDYGPYWMKLKDGPEKGKWVRRDENALWIHEWNSLCRDVEADTGKELLETEDNYSGDATSFANWLNIHGFAKFFREWHEKGAEEFLELCLNCGYYNNNICANSTKTPSGEDLLPKIHPVLSCHYYQARPTPQQLEEARPTPQQLEGFLRVLAERAIDEEEDNDDEEEDSEDENEVDDDAATLSELFGHGPGPSNQSAEIKKDRIDQITESIQADPDAGKMERIDQITEDTPSDKVAVPVVPAEIISGFRNDIWGEEEGNEDEMFEAIKTHLVTKEHQVFLDENHYTVQDLMKLDFRLSEVDIVASIFEKWNISLGFDYFMKARELGDTVRAMKVKKTREPIDRFDQVIGDDEETPKKVTAKSATKPTVDIANPVDVRANQDKENYIKELEEWIREHCGKSGSHNDERCSACGRCPITTRLRH